MGRAQWTFFENHNCFLDTLFLRNVRYFLAVKCFINKNIFFQYNFFSSWKFPSHRSSVWSWQTIFPLLIRVSHVSHTIPSCARVTLQSLPFLGQQKISWTLQSYLLIIRWWVQTCYVLKFSKGKKKKDRRSWVHLDEKLSCV